MKITKERILSVVWMESRQRGCSLDAGYRIVFGTIKRLRAAGWSTDRALTLLEYRQVKDLPDRKVRKVSQTLEALRNKLKYEEILEDKIALKDEVTTVLDGAKSAVVERIVSGKWTLADIRYIGQRIRRKKAVAAMDLLGKLPPRMAVEAIARILNE